MIVLAPSNPKLSCTVLLLIASSCIACVAQGRGEADQNLKREVRSFESADRSDAARKAFDRLCTIATPEQLQTIRNGPDDSLAVATDWRNLLSQTEPESVPTRHELWKFFGFVEGRGKCSLPQWWQNAIYWYFVSPPDFQDRKYPSVEQLVKRTEDKSGYYIELGRRKILLPIPGDVEIEDGTFAVDRNRAYIALHPTANQDFRLICFDIESDSIIWDSWVWARPGVSYGGWSGAEIMLLNERVAVFGVNGAAVYLAIFHAKTGRSLLRFTTAIGSKER